MKYYETTFDEYIASVEKYNLHPEMAEIVTNTFPKHLREFGNLIVYGPSGIGKYSQVLHFLKKYSPTELKYEKYMTIQTDKQSYTYCMSDIHYEIDMAFLGCNSKLLWHELFFQIVDIIAVKPEKIGIIVCKNFHMIHSELLDIFYSYMQQYNNSYMNLLIKFVILTEHISFLPTNILQSCEVIGMRRPTSDQYLEMIEAKSMKMGTKAIMSQLEPDALLNLKEIRSFSLVKTVEQLPTDIFNTICDEIIQDITHVNIDFIKFRDSLYDILIYNLDVAECLWYILTHFIKGGLIGKKEVSQVLQKTYSFLKYYNNNYRPIYHLESMFLYIVIKIHGYDNEEKSIANSGNKKERKSVGRTSKKAVSYVGTEIPSGQK